jgi:predicted peroxiredoxin
MRSEDRMKFVYMVTTGTDDPTKASLPLHLAANGSVEVGHDTAVLLAGDATEMLFGDNLEQMQGIGVPPVRELIAKLRDHAVPVYVWRGCAVARGATEEHLAKVNGSWVTPPDAAELCAGADKLLTF